MPSRFILCTAVQPLLARMGDAGTLRIVGARYALYTALVELV